MDPENIINERIGAHFGQVVSTILTTTDSRVAAIMPVAFLETHLESLIAARLPGLNGELKNTMFGTTGLISSVAAKISFAQALGIIDGPLAKRMIRLVRIRNRFAHNLDIDRFSHPEIVKLMSGVEFDENGLDFSLPNGEKAVMEDTLDARFLTEATRVCGDIINCHTDGAGFTYEGSGSLTASHRASPSISLAPRRKMKEVQHPKD